MLFAIAMILLVLWLMGFAVFHIAGAIVHLVLDVALVLFVMGLFRNGSA